MRNTGRPLLQGMQKKKRIASVFFAVLLSLIAVLLTVGVWFSSNFFAVQVDGESMTSTLKDGDWLYAERGKSAKRGDIVTVDVHDYKNAAGEPVFQHAGAGGLVATELIIKRVIAVGGDSIKCDEEGVWVKPQGGKYELREEPYALGETGCFEEIVIPEGYVFLMGDNRENSKDSRDGAVGALPAWRITGVVPQWAMKHKGAIAKWENFRRGVGNLF